MQKNHRHVVVMINQFNSKLIAKKTGKLMTKLILLSSNNKARPKRIYCYGQIKNSVHS